MKISSNSETDYEAKAVTDTSITSFTIPEYVHSYPLFKYSYNKNKDNILCTKVRLKITFNTEDINKKLHNDDVYFLKKT